MENLAYLYILAEEAEQQVKNSNICYRQMQGNKHIAPHRSTSVSSVQTVEGVKVSSDDDRAHPAYPTFYL